MLNWTLESERCLRGIHDHIACDNRAAAKRTIAGIRKKARMLEDAPELGYRYENPEFPGVRIILKRPYQIAYRILDDGDIDILGVYHPARGDIGDFLKIDES